MAGQPRRRAMVAELTRRAREYFEVGEGEPDPSLVDYAVAWIESGGTLTGLADEITHEWMIEVRREMLSTYLNRVEGENGARRLADARARGGHAVAETGLQNLEQAASEEESRHAERVNRAKQWLAERWNREELGKAPDVNVSISADALYLQALQRASQRLSDPANVPVPDSLPPADVPAIDVEVTSDEEAQPVTPQ